MSAKRFFDLVCTIPGLILLSPLFVLIAFKIKIDSEGPVFFKQTRVGKNGKLFKIIKFRTMIQNAESKGLQLTSGNDNRITQFGRFLRKMKMDELPQLINVLLGEMSLVGPRPEVPRYVDFYPEQIRKIVLSVLPGITDRTSIEFINEPILLSGSNDAERTYIEEIMPIKIKCYVDYVQNQSLLEDIKIILDTIKTIIKKNPSR